MYYDPTISAAGDRTAVTVTREELRRNNEGIREFAFRAQSTDGAPLRDLALSWRIPQRGIFFRWHPAGGVNRSIPPDWAPPEKVENTRSMPLMQLLGSNHRNVFTFAFSDCTRPVAIRAAIVEETSEILCEVKISFSGAEVPFEYSARLRTDCRDIFYADALRDAALWMEKESGPAFPVPECAWEPAYSSWYSFHQYLSEERIENQCRFARAYGMKTLILDDGWQTADGKRGYAFCGDWEPDPEKFPDFKAHVRRVHELGFRYVLWCAPPLAGIESSVLGRFEEKILSLRPNRDAAILDPRFPEVRDYLAEKIISLVRRYDLDGLKLDFIDSFSQPEPERVLPAGCDTLLVGDAVEKLFARIIEAVSGDKPDFLIEFRQLYIGPRMRRYAPILRAADSPGDILLNRVRTIDLRLGCPGRAIHSDMITWNYGEPPESAALQLLNVLFSVPQISLRLDEIPAGQREMLAFWMRFFARFRQTLLHGRLCPFHPELNYPLVFAEGADGVIAVAYQTQLRIIFEAEPAGGRILINATGTECEFTVATKRPLGDGRIYTAGGKLSEKCGELSSYRTFRLPPSGLLIFDMENFS